MFAQARTLEGFANVTVDAETGTCVAGGTDLAPDTLYVGAQSSAWADRDVAA